MRVCDVMTKQVETVGPDATVQDAARAMKERDIGVLPVCEGDRIIGMLTDRDITVRVVAEGRNGAKVRDAMTTDVFCANEEDALDEVAATMRSKQIKRIPVLDANKRLVGIVSLGDLAQSDSALAGEANEGITEGAGDEGEEKEDTKVSSPRTKQPSSEGGGTDRSRAQSRGGDRPPQGEPGVTATGIKRQN